MKTYNERQLALAEEFARAEWRRVMANEKFDWDRKYLTDSDKKQRIDNMLPQAAIALKHKAEAYAEGCSTILLDKDEIQRNLFLMGYEPQTEKI